MAMYTYLGNVDRTSFVSAIDYSGGRVFVGDQVDLTADQLAQCQRAGANMVSGVQYFDLYTFPYETAEDADNNIMTLG